MSILHHGARAVAGFAIIAGILGFPAAKAPPIGAKAPRPAATAVAVESGAHRRPADTRPSSHSAEHEIVGDLGGAGGVREQELDTQVPEAPRPPPPPQPTPRLPPPECAPTIMPPNANRKVQTPQDEDLPSWVPICGRLTVIESSDMAENLGLVPPGTTKASAEKISVAQKLEEEAAERAAHPPPASTGWTFIPGETFVDAR